MQPTGTALHAFHEAGRSDLAEKMIAEERHKRIKAMIARRRAIENAAASRPDLHDALRGAAAADVIAFINDWCWTFNPKNASRGLPTDVPFDLFQRQEEFLGWLIERERSGGTGLVKKSREMGLTWLACAFYVHRWLFRPGWSGKFGSRKRDLVDRLGDMDSIMEKVRFILRRLPQWMQPSRYEDSLCRIVNPAIGTSITGEGGDSMGRGGRGTMYFVDEFAFVERPHRVNAAISQNADAIIKASTPNGEDNIFAEECEGGRYPVFTLHWRSHPEKDDAWYARQCANMSAIDVAREIDIDFSASVKAIFGDERGAYEWGYYEPADRPIEGRRVQSWDTAYKKGEENSWNARVDAIVAGGAIYILDAWWAKLEYPELKETFEKTAAIRGEVLVEDKASGQSLIQEFRRPSQWRPLGLPIVAINPDSDKVARAHAMTPHVKAKKILLPRGATFVPGWLKAFSSFGEDGGNIRGTCIDLVDAASQLIEYVNLQPIEPVAPHETDPLATGRDHAPQADPTSLDGLFGGSDGMIV